MSERHLALVTGASLGMGKEFATLLAADHDLVITSRNVDRLEELAATLRTSTGAKVIVLPADLSKIGAAKNLFDQLTQHKLAPNVLINSAGFGTNGLFCTTPLENTHELLQVNVVALTELTRLLLPHMLEKKYGRILNLASMASFVSGPLMATYFASKAYVLSFSVALADETRGTGVTVTAVCPGPVKTSFAARIGMEKTKVFSVGAQEARLASKRALDAMHKGKTVAFTSFKHRLQVAPVPMLPRTMIARIARGYNTI